MQKKLLRIHFLFLVTIGFSGCFSSYKAYVENGSFLSNPRTLRADAYFHIVSRDKITFYIATDSWKYDEEYRLVPVKPSLELTHFKNRSCRYISKDNHEQVMIEVDRAGGLNSVISDENIWLKDQAIDKVRVSIGRPIHSEWEKKLTSGRGIPRTALRDQLSFLYTIRIELFNADGKLLGSYHEKQEVVNLSAKWWEFEKRKKLKSNPALQYSSHERNSGAYYRDFEGLKADCPNFAK